MGKRGAETAGGDGGGEKRAKKAGDGGNSAEGGKLAILKSLLASKIGALPSKKNTGSSKGSIAKKVPVAGHGGSKGEKILSKGGKGAGTSHFDRARGEGTQSHGGGGAGRPPFNKGMGQNGMSHKAANGAVEQAGRVPKDGILATKKGKGQGGQDVAAKKEGNAAEVSGQGAAEGEGKPATKLGVGGKPVSSNWLALQEELKKQKKEKLAAKNGGSKGESALPRGGKDMLPGYIVPDDYKKTQYTGPLAMDCEMVGVGEGGKKSVLARVSIVDFHGNVVIDSYVAPQEKVTDLRTWVSGIRWQDLKGAPKFSDIQKVVGHVTDGMVIVGHALSNDLEALMLKHPKHMIRDTAKYKPYMRLKRSRKLKDLCKEELGLDIQSGEHSSVEDARSALLLYKQVRVAWEAECAELAAKKAKFSKNRAAPKEPKDKPTVEQ